jgi:hypothetical protein
MASSNSAPNGQSGDSPSEIAIRQAAGLFEQIANCATAADRLCYYSDPCEQDFDRLHHELDLMRELMLRVGWLADLGAAKIGGSVTRGDAEQWMLPPVYNAIGGEASHD